jgi:hypothetical protein
MHRWSKEKMMEEERGRCCPSSCPKEAGGGALAAVQQHLLPVIKMHISSMLKQRRGFSK